jgi:hypothetical protein
VEPFDYKFVDKIERPGTRTEELYGGGWGKSTSWVGYAKQFADIVNGCAYFRMHVKLQALAAGDTCPCTRKDMWLQGSPACCASSPYLESKR